MTLVRPGMVRTLVRAHPTWVPSLRKSPPDDLPFGDPKEQ